MHSKAKELKAQLMENRRYVDFDGVAHLCEGQLMIVHTCSHDVHMNETLFPKNIFSKLPNELKGYFYHKINCHLCCGKFHFSHGHSSRWRQFFYELQCERYGDDVVQEFIDNAPLKIKRRK